MIRFAVVFDKRWATLELLEELVAAGKAAGFTVENHPATLSASAIWKRITDHDSWKVRNEHPPRELSFGPDRAYELSSQPLSIFDMWIWSSLPEAHDNAQRLGSWFAHHPACAVIRVLSSTERLGRVQELSALDGSTAYVRGRGLPYLSNINWYGERIAERIGPEALRKLGAVQEGCMQRVDVLPLLPDISAEAFLDRVKEASQPLAEVGALAAGNWGKTNNWSRLPADGKYPPPFEMPPLKLTPIHFPPPPPPDTDKARALTKAAEEGVRALFAEFHSDAWDFHGDKRDGFMRMVEDAIEIDPGFAPARRLRCQIAAWTMNEPELALRWARDLPTKPQDRELRELLRSGEEYYVGRVSIW